MQAPAKSMSPSPPRKPAGGAVGPKKLPAKAPGKMLPGKASPAKGRTVSQSPAGRAAGAASPSPSPAKRSVSAAAAGKMAPAKAAAPPQSLPATADDPAADTSADTAAAASEVVAPAPRPAAVKKAPPKGVGAKKAPGKRPPAAPAGAKAKMAQRPPAEVVVPATTVEDGGDEGNSDGSRSEKPSGSRPATPPAGAVVGDDEVGDRALTARSDVSASPPPPPLSPRGTARSSSQASASSARSATPPPPPPPPQPPSASMERADGSRGATAQATEGVVAMAAVPGGATSRAHERRVEDLERQLVEAQSRIEHLNRIVSRLEESLYEKERPGLVQHVLELERENRNLRVDVQRHEASVQHYRDAHLQALEELGEVKQRLDRYGEHEQLVAKNKRLEQQLNDVARERAEWEWRTSGLEEQLRLVHATEKRQASAGASAFVYVRRAALCGPCAQQIAAGEEQETQRALLWQATHAAAPPATRENQVPESLAGRWERSPQVMLTRQTITEAPPLRQAAGYVDPSLGGAPVTSTPHDRRDLVARPSATPSPTSSAATAGSRWRTSVAPDGRLVYYNPITNTSTYSRPPAMQGA